jgi:hypothetical protein
MFSYVSMEERVPQDHPLRAIRRLVDQILTPSQNRARPAATGAVKADVGS